MGRIAHTFRRKGGTYVVRKRLPYRSFGSRHITLGLGTKDPCLARIRAPAVCAALDWAVAMVEQTIILNGGARSASETARLVRAACDMKLGFALADHRLGHDAEAAAANLAFGDYYELAARHDGVPFMTAEDETRLRTSGRSEAHVAAVRRMVALNTGDPALSNSHLKLQLEALGFAFSPTTANADRQAVLSGWAKAQLYAPHFNNPAVQASGTPEAYLLDHGHSLTTASSMTTTAFTGTASAESAQVAPHSQKPAGDNPSSSGPMLSEVADGVVDDIIRRGNWKAGPHGTGEQARRLVRQVIWTIGDMPAGLFSQTHLNAFIRELWLLPTSVRVQSVWHKCYDAAKIDFPALTNANTRSPRSVNNNLAYLATFAAGMAMAGHWRKDQLAFAGLGHKVSKAVKKGARPPWTMQHIDTLFASPIYNGNDGSRRRLKPGSLLFQDAAYWVLAVTWFTASRREEVCGLRTEDVVVNNTAIPHLVYRPNHLRGLKNEASERAIPLHPQLIALGFLDYVAAMRDQGHTAVFPELWIFDGKRGAAQYYSICWSKQVGWLRAQPGVVIPVGVGGKEADLHSVRKTSLSQLDRAGIDQNIVADIAGHARAGITAQTYQDLVASGGLDDVLGERLIVIQRLPNPLQHLSPPPLQFLPLNLRTR